LVPKGPGNPSAIQKEFTSKRHQKILFLYPSRRKGIYGTFQGKSPVFLTIDAIRVGIPIRILNMEAGKSTPSSLGKNRQLRQDIESLDKERQNKERRYIDIYDYIRNSGSTKREVQWWE
jgi:hypothetical protein